MKTRCVLKCLLTMGLVLMMPMVSVSGAVNGQIILSHAAEKNIKSSSSDGVVEYYAVVAGCTRYQDWRNNIFMFLFDPLAPLGYVATALKESSNWKEDHIIELYNDQATKENILFALSDMAMMVDEDDVFLFQWMGHGSNITDEDGDEFDGFDELICPYDIGVDNGSRVNYITDDELDQYLSAIPSSSQVILIESCLSGGMAEENSSRDGFSDVGNKGQVVIMSTPPGRLGKGLRPLVWPISYHYSLGTVRSGN